MINKMKHKGFTVVELLIVIVILGVGGWLFFSEKARIDAMQRDGQRKTAINAMYYNLEEDQLRSGHRPDEGHLDPQP